MTSETVSTLGTSHVLGRRPKSSPEEIIRTAWALFEKDGYESTTMADIAEASGISRRTLFNYFPTKEALLYPAVDAYMVEFTQCLVNRPSGEPLFSSLEQSLLQCRDKQIELEDMFNPGPVVHAARLEESAIRYTRDLWAREMEKAVSVKLANVPGGTVLAGFVGALAAQVWTEITKQMKADGPGADISNALAVAMSSLRKLFT